jgi:branched-chain amino acid aminotransferase
MHNESGYSPSFLIQNGALVERGVAGVSLNDGAIVSGQGAFETLAVYQGQPFLVEAHLKRLSEAAERLGLSCPSDPVLSEAIGTAIRANDLEDASMARVRITLTSPPQGESWIVEATLPPHHPESARLITIPYVRNERGALSGLKTINYGENAVAMKLAREAGADEALFGNTQDQLCEGTWSNVFIFVEGHYLTPPLSSGCLPGVTRQIVREILGELDLSCAESDFPMNRLGEIDGAFLTSSLREIQPAASLDGRSLELPPGLTEIKAAFRNRVARGA